MPIFLINNENETSAKPKNQNYMTRYITNKSINSFVEDINDETFQQAIDQDDPKKSYNSFMEIFQEKYNKHFPLKKSKTTKIRLNKSPWITQGIVKSSRTKNKLYKRIIKYPNKKHETKY